MKRRTRKLKSSFRPFEPKFFIVTAKHFSWILIVLVVISLVIAAYFSNIFAIKKILCVHNDRPCSPAVEAELNNLMGQNILLFRYSELEEKLKLADVSVQQVLVKPILPHTISVHLSSRGATITISPATGSASLLVDATNVPFDIDEHPKSPAQIISSNVNNLRIGEQINDPIILSAISLSQSLTDNFVSYEFIQTEQERLNVLLKNGTVAIFEINANYALKVPSLQYILREATIGKKPKIIDLRFNKPVLRF